MWFPREGPLPSFCLPSPLFVECLVYLSTPLSFFTSVQQPGAWCAAELLLLGSEVKGRSGLGSKYPSSAIPLLGRQGDLNGGGHAPSQLACWDGVMGQGAPTYSFMLKSCPQDKNVSGGRDF